MLNVSEMWHTYKRAPEPYCRSIHHFTSRRKEINTNTIYMAMAKLQAMKRRKQHHNNSARHSFAILCDYFRIEMDVDVTICFCFFMRCVLHMLPTEQQ